MTTPNAEDREILQYATLVQLQTDLIDDGVQMLMVRGNATEADEAPSFWLRDDSAGTVTSADLKKWRKVFQVEESFVAGGVTPEQYGAAGDGTTDDSTAWQNWINSVEALGLVGMGKPGSTYKLTATRTVDASNVILRGNGAKILFDNPTLNGDIVIDVAGTKAAPLTNFEFSGWRVECTNTLDRIVHATATDGIRVFRNTVEQGRLFFSFVPADSLARTQPTYYFTITSGSGTFTDGETVEGGTSGALGVVRNTNSTSYLNIRVTSGTFASGETVTGASSSASAELTSSGSARPSPDVVEAAAQCRNVQVWKNICTADDSLWPGAAHEGPSGDRADWRTQVSISSVTGAFQQGEEVTYGGGTAYVAHVLASSLILRKRDGVPAVSSGITITGSTSGATATTGTATVGSLNELTGDGLNTSIISPRWVDTATITGNILRNTRNGILWWGGDSNFGRDGYFGVARPCRNISITGNFVENCSAGGIWGGNGMDLAITGNTVRNGLDIGIHGEGSYGITVTGNTITNFKFGAINPYFLEERAVYSSNTLMIDDGDTYGDVLIKNNLGADRTDFEVLVIGNHVEMADSGYVGRVELQRGGTIILKDNLFKRVIVDGDGSNAGERRIVGNEFMFPDDPGAPAIEIGGSIFAGEDRPMVHVIENNRFICWDWTGTGFQPCIYSKQAQANGTRTSTAIIRANRIQGATINATDGFPQDIVTESTNNTGAHATDVVENGLWKGIAFDISDKFGVGIASLNQFIMHRDNYSSNVNNSTPYSAPPEQGVYLLGSRVKIDRPTVGGATEYVVAGTAKVFAPTSGTYGAGTDYEIGDQIDYDPGSGSRVYVAKRESGPGSIVVTPGGGSKTYDPPSLADGATDATTVTVTGARSGDPVTVQFSTSLPDGYTATGEVTADDTVTVTFDNGSGGTVDAASGTLTAYTDHWRDVAPLTTASAFYGYGYTRLSGSKTYQPGGGAGIADGAEDSTTVSINGIDTGDVILGVQFSADLDGARISGWQITASNTATVWFKNDSGVSASPVSGTLSVYVEKG